MEWLLPRHISRERSMRWPRWLAPYCWMSNTLPFQFTHNPIYDPIPKITTATRECCCFGGGASSRRRPGFGCADPNPLYIGAHLGAKPSADITKHKNANRDQAQVSAVAAVELTAAEVCFSTKFNPSKLTPHIPSRCTLASTHIWPFQFCVVFC